MKNIIIPLGEYFWVQKTQQVYSKPIPKYKMKFFSLLKNLPSIPVIALNVPGKQSKHLLLFKCLRQKINGKPLKFLLQLIPHNILENKDWKLSRFPYHWGPLRGTEFSLTPFNKMSKNMTHFCFIMSQLNSVSGYRIEDSVFYLIPPKQTWLFLISSVDTRHF